MLKVLTVLLIAFEFCVAGIGQKTANSTSAVGEVNATFSSFDILPASKLDQRQDNGHVRNKRFQRKSEEKCYSTYFQNIVPVISGGAIAKSGEFTHMAALGWRRTSGTGFDYRCGGTLVSPIFVLTAAHCTSIGGQAPTVVRVGGASLTDSSLVNQPIQIAKIHVYPQYNRKQVYHDIALLRLSSLSKYKPACLWPSRTFNFNSATAIGYGQTSFGGVTSNNLLKVDLQIFSNQVCSKYYTSRYRLTSGIIDSQFCAGDFSKIRDTCQGDSGGPIMVKSNTRGKIIPYVLGVTSFGQGCAGGPPSVYVKISSYLDWVESVVWPTIS